MPLYAEAGFQEAWLIDLTRYQIEAYRDPTAGGFREIRIFRRGDRLSLRAFADVELAVDEILA